MKQEDNDLHLNEQETQMNAEHGSYCVCWI